MRTIAVHFRRFILLLLVIAQTAGVAQALPAAVCERPDGSASFHSTLTPCCCITHRETSCCEDEVADVAGTEPMASSGCGCVDTPIPAQPAASRLAGQRTLSDSAPSELQPAVVMLPEDASAAPSLSLSQGRFRWTSPTGPPDVYLNTVILRL